MTSARVIWFHDSLGASAVLKWETDEPGCCGFGAKHFTMPAADTTDRPPLAHSLRSCPMQIGPMTTGRYALASDIQRVFRLRGAMVFPDTAIKASLYPNSLVPVSRSTRSRSQARASAVQHTDTKSISPTGGYHPVR